ncbi:uncharacterized protein [Ptychodera flava]|uniref:uncharacterized protein n=1 Tax=Ptychodera flava TaxID=63121 RepID=UPI003969FABD
MSAMATTDACFGSDRESFSQYFASLDGVSKTRYMQKIELCDFIDPYTLQNKQLSPDPKRFPEVQYPDIVNYLVLQTSFCTGEQVKNWKSMDAYNFFISGWVQPLFSKTLTGDKILILGRVNHSQRCRETPLETWVLADKGGRILTAHCNCMAGLCESCSHVGAMLFALEAATKLNKSLTCTDEKSKWLPCYKKQIAYKECRDMDFTSAKSKKKRLDNALEGFSVSETPVKQKPQKRRVTINDEVAKVFLEKISKSGTKPACLSLVPGYHMAYIPKSADTSLPKPLVNLYNDNFANMSLDDLKMQCSSVEIPLENEECKRVEEETRQQAGSNLWFTHRAGRITASKLRAAVHTKPDNPSRSLIKSICYPKEHHFSSKATK